MTERDVFALRWIGQQYAVRLDQLQHLLGQRPGHGAVHEGVISESATRDVVTRWRKAGWVCMERLRANQPPWIWLTRKGIHKVDLSYIYQDLHSLNTQEREHLYAINEVRLQDGDVEEGSVWISERTLLQGVSRVKAKELPHRPDAVLYEDGEIIAIEVELSRKSIALLSNILVSLVHDEDYHGETYHDLKATVGMDKAQLLCQDDWKNYTSIDYYAPAPLRTYWTEPLRRLHIQSQHRLP